MYEEDDLIALSALSQFVFCPRRFALVHIEGLWADNRFTAEGRQFHERVHEAEPTESRADVRTARGLRLRSLRLGLSGVADVVEFHRLPEDAAPGSGIPLAWVSGLWQPFPVEYKSGKRRWEQSYEAQLCGQAMCLEEMLGVPVGRGALFYGRSRRRLEVEFTPDLRLSTEQAAARLHELAAQGRTPAARYEKKCRSCSLIHACLPRATGAAQSARAYLDRILEESADIT